MVAFRNTAGSVCFKINMLLKSGFNSLGNYFVCLFKGFIYVSNIQFKVTVDIVIVQESSALAGNAFVYRCLLYTSDAADEL